MITSRMKDEYITTCTQHKTGSSDFSYVDKPHKRTIDKHDHRNNFRLQQNQHFKQSS